MKKTFPSELSQEEPLPDDVVEEWMADGLLPEYGIDSSKARPNHFAARQKALAGRLDALAEQANQEFDAGRCRPL